MSEYRPRLKAHQVRLLIYALRIIRSRVDYELRPTVTLDIRIVPCVELARDEIDELLSKLEGLFT